jgi:hypothetical protein
MRVPIGTSQHQGQRCVWMDSCCSRCLSVLYARTKQARFFRDDDFTIRRKSDDFITCSRSMSTNETCSDEHTFRNLISGEKAISGPVENQLSMYVRTTFLHPTPTYSTALLAIRVERGTDCPFRPFCCLPGCPSHWLRAPWRTRLHRRQPAGRRGTDDQHLLTGGYWGRGRTYYLLRTATVPLLSRRSRRHRTPPFRSSG